jgi:L-lactate dehydrogenase complex protein LldG
MTEKHEMLASIRAALGRDESAAAPAALPSFAFRSVAQTREEITNRFCTELERIGGRVLRVDSPEAIKEYLDGLIPKDAPAFIAVSDAAALSRIGLRDRLIASGVSVTGTLKEFAQSGAFEPESPARAGDASLMESYKQALMGVQIGVTTADYGIADTGTLVLVSQKRDVDLREQHRLISLVPPAHVCLIDLSRIVASLADLIKLTHDEFYSGQNPPLAMTFITGPSRTADIELTLALGVHGPRELHVLLYQSDGFAPARPA